MFQFFIILYIFLRVLFINSLTIKLILTNNTNTNENLAQKRINRLLQKSLIKTNQSQLELTKKGERVYLIFRLIQYLLHKDLSKIESRIKYKLNV